MRPKLVRVIYNHFQLTVVHCKVGKEENRKQKFISWPLSAASIEINLIYEMLTPNSIALMKSCRCH